MKPESQCRILYVESYGSGSHIHSARLLQSRSRHIIDILYLDRDHWRTIALTGHRAVLDGLSHLGPRTPYDIILFSGPADLRLISLGMPDALRQARIIAYFHESQWTYPAENLDRIPYLVNHIEIFELADAVWFNSRYHQRVFFSTALNHPSRPLRNIARQVLPPNQSKAQVVYPPVAVNDHPRRRENTIAMTWSARWEREKRPDLLIAISKACLDAGLDFTLNILGCDVKRWHADPVLPAELRAVVSDVSGFPDRENYERILAASDIWLSTAEHEYFGISAIEASLLGATLILPGNLAYPETLPSAITYPPGDVVAATRRVLAVARSKWPGKQPWQHDARRFLCENTVRAFDAAAKQTANPDRLHPQNENVFLFDCPS